MEQILHLQICEAKPNKLFTEEQRQMCLFLRYNKAVECRRCGKKRKLMWTMLCQFKAHEMGDFSLDDGGMSFEPLDAVCSNHPIGPDFPEAGAMLKGGV